MAPLSRRSFLATSSLTLAGLATGMTRTAHALPMRSRLPVSAHFADLLGAETLQQLALTSVDTAKQAGAAYADVRVSDMRHLRVMMESITPIPWSTIDFNYAYGVRVLVNGVWGFTFGTDPTRDGIAHATRRIVETTRGVSTIGTHSVELPPVPVVKGTWTTPIHIDPFSVSPDAHEKIIGAYIDAIGRVPDGGADGMLGFLWTAETRVFASTEESVITQHFTRAEPRLILRSIVPLRSRGMLQMMQFMPSSAGLDGFLGDELQERIKQATEETARLASYPIGDVDVGRYQAVLDGEAVAALVGGTLAPALEMSRVLGHDADGAGTSFLSPVDDIVGQPLFSPLLNVVSDRSLPAYGAAKWDDEGVATEPFSVITNGQVVDYFATRSTVASLANWYAKTGKPLRTHGSAVSCDVTISPIGCASHLRVASGAAGTLDQLVRTIDNGLLVRGSYPWVHTDQQLSGGVLPALMIFEVKKGAITRQLKGSIQFSTKRLWKNIDAVGDQTTLQYQSCVSRRGETWANAIMPVVAPAVHVSQLEVIEAGERR